ncbi:exosortase A [Nitrogeniibacter mangrovi]|uniref:Exosortase A n=1 Tax=Nitrogeniibacter mangrovi TaxID=2016596 RepID=A0A6C1B8G8_9RHOO|nr:exosortase A [Nitrogeniibacter mangrovi]QID18544.1 exosortase A [Nitrogeniibacter mangrovi]
MSAELAQSRSRASVLFGGQVGRNLLFLLMLVAVWSLLLWPTLNDMIQLWLRSETFAHGLVVMPIAAYLVWSRRQQLVGVMPQPAWIMLAPFLLALTAWSAGVAFSVAGVEHFAGVLVLITMVWLCAGHEFFRVIAFPMGFLLFMAPVGDFLIPVMMQQTAQFTVEALRLSGIPVYQEGTHFVVPNGSWSVVSACSGIRYLIASLMVGVLYAYLNYRSLKKRLLFVLVALLVPIVANWVRAYLIVLLGYLSGNTLAVGVDHLIYGWVFFGFVVLLMFWIGNRWADPSGEAMSDVRIMPLSTRRGRWYGGVPVAVILLGLAALATHAVRPVDRPFALKADLPPAEQGWVLDEDATPFAPGFQGFRGEMKGVYRRDGAVVSLYTALYADQAPGHELVAWFNQLVPDKKTWRIVAQNTELVAAGRVNHVRMTGPDGPVNVWHWYVVGDAVEASDYVAGFRVVWRRLWRGTDRGAHVVIAVAGEDDAAARASATRFIAAHHGAITRAIEHATEQAH